MKYKAILQSIFTLALLISLSSSNVYAGEVFGNLSSAGVNTVNNTSGTIGGTVGNGGSQVSGTLSPGSISGSVSGGSNSGGSGGGSGGSGFPIALANTTDTNSNGSVLGTSTSIDTTTTSNNSSSNNTNYFSDDETALQTNNNVSNFEQEISTEEIAIATDFIPVAEAETFDQSANIVNTDGVWGFDWLWIILLLLILIAISMYIYSRSKEREKPKFN